jgi:hypothetical protein
MRELTFSSVELPLAHVDVAEQCVSGPAAAEGCRAASQADGVPDVAVVEPIIGVLQETGRRWSRLVATGRRRGWPG